MADDLLTAFQMLSNSVKEYALQDVFTKADEQVKAIKDAGLTDMKARRAIQDVAQSVGIRALGLGADASQVDSVRKLLQGPDPTTFSNPMEAIMSGLTQQGASPLEAATTAIGIQEEQAIKAEQRRANIAAQTDERRAKLRPPSKSSQLNPKERADISDLRVSVDTFKDLTSFVDDNKSLIGPASGRIWSTKVSDLDPKAAEFRTRVDQLFNEYRKRITGAAAAVQELEVLQQSFISGKETLASFKAKLRVIQGSAQKTLNTKLDTAKRSGINVDAFSDIIEDDKMGSAPAANALPSRASLKDFLQ